MFEFFTRNRNYLPISSNDDEIDISNNEQIDISNRNNRI